MREGEVVEDAGRGEHLPAPRTAETADRRPDGTLGEAPSGIVVVGASAGGVEALTRFVRSLPADLPATVCVVLHLPAGAPSALAAILDRAGPLPAASAVDGQPILPGRVVVAPPDHHLVVGDDHLQLVRGPRENRHRPAVDPLFRSAARSHGARVVAVVLSGALDDGANGAQHVKHRGGRVLVQRPEEALFDGMPRAAIARGVVDDVLPIDRLGPAVAALVSKHQGGEQPMVRDGADAAQDGDSLLAGVGPGSTPDGAPSGFGCPECGGVLWEAETNGEGTPGFRCRVGHTYAPETLLAGQDETLETALWSALRALEEKAELASRLVGVTSRRGGELTSGRFAEQAAEATNQAVLLRDMLVRAEEPQLGTASTGAGAADAARTAVGE